MMSEVESKSRENKRQVQKLTFDVQRREQLRLT